MVVMVLVLITFVRILVSRGVMSMSPLVVHLLVLTALIFMHHEFPGAQGIVIHDVAMRKRADVGVQEKALAVLEQAIGVLQVGFAFADGLDLGTAQGDSGLEPVEEGVVVARSAVLGGVAESGGNGVAVLRLRSGLWLRCDSRNGGG